MKNIFKNIIHPTTRQNSKRQPMPESVRRGFRYYSTAVLSDCSDWLWRCAVRKPGR